MIIEFHYIKILTDDFCLVAMATISYKRWWKMTYYFVHMKKNFLCIIFPTK